jgi:hypothetical protein
LERTAAAVYFTGGRASRVRRRGRSTALRWALVTPSSMFEPLEPKRSHVRIVVLRALISLAAGAILTFALNGLIGAVWSYLQDEHFQPRPFAVVLVRVLNLPAVIYCRYFSLPPGLPKSDEGLYCWAVGFLFNILYYAVIIFVLWSIVRWLKSRRERRAVSNLTAGAN